MVEEQVDHHQDSLHLHPVTEREDQKELKKCEHTHTHKVDQSLIPGLSSELAAGQWNDVTFKWQRWFHEKTVEMVWMDGGKFWRKCLVNDWDF